METTVIGYVATSASIIGLLSQFVHTYRSKTTAGVSMTRMALDSLGLILWIAYAARLEDLPLLIATSVELATSCAVLVIIYKHRTVPRIKDITPPNSTDSSVIIEVPHKIELVTPTDTQSSNTTQ
jgi:uncharacterized protein with PQ loop repeat